MHTEPGAHGRLQPPQCAGFDAVSTQAPEHSCVPPRHARVHWPLVQRRPAAHALPHMPQLERSLRGSTQAPLQLSSGAAQRVPQRPSTHSPVPQSLVRLQPCPIVHLAQAPPPQSTSVSRPSRSWLVQDGATQPPSTHAPPAHCEALAHADDVPHAGHGPPQSTPVSSPFCTSSAHEGAAHRFKTHDALAQSPSTRHHSPSAQPPQRPPPQSRSVSRPLRRPSVQSEGRCVTS